MWYNLLRREICVISIWNIIISFYGNFAILFIYLYSAFSPVTESSVTYFRLDYEGALYISRDTITNKEMPLRLRTLYIFIVSR